MHDKRDGFRVDEIAKAERELLAGSLPKPATGPLGMPPSLSPSQAGERSGERWRVRAIGKASADLGQGHSKLAV
jgi:hypothetical protein